jgi:DNA-directed RNA polymerase delta subunit
MMKKITILALFATLLSLSLNAQNPNNLLDGRNPGFENFSATDPCFWWFTQVDSASGLARGKITYTTVNPKEGTRSLRAEVTAINPNTQWHVQAASSEFYPLKAFKAGSTVDTQSYTVRFWAKADIAGKKMNVVIQKGAPSYETPFERTVTLTTSWVQYTYKFKVPADGDLRPLFHMGLETGIFFVDYVEMAQTELIDAPPPADKNFMKPNNPSFEIFTATDIAPNWFLQVDSAGTSTARGAITAITTGAQDGARAIKAVVTAISPNPYQVQAVHNNFYAFKKAKAVGTGDQSYTLRYWAKADVAGKKINTLIQNAAYGTVALPADKTMTLTTEWAQYTYTFTVTADDMMKPAIHLGLEKGTFYLDNFELGKTEDIVVTPPVVDKNFMMPNNPSFESYTAADPAPSWFLQVDTSGTNTARGAITIVGTGSQQGTYALQAVVTAVTATQPWNIQAQHNPFYDFKKLKATGTGDQSYTLRFWAKADAAGKKINALIQNAAYGTVALPDQQTMTLTTTWAQYTYTFTVSKDDMMRPVVHMGLEKGTFFLDNFELGKTEDIVVTPPVVDKNFMMPNNPSFESYTAANPAPSWFLQVDTSGTNTARGAITIVGTGAQQGTYALQAVVTAVTATQPWNIQAQHNPFYAFKKAKAVGTGDQSYTLRFWAKADAAGKKINALVQNAAYSTVAVPNQITMTLTAAWAQYTYTFTVSADDQMRPVVHMGLEKGTFFLDNFELGKTEDIISGVNQIPVRTDIVVAPNPTTGLFEIKSTERFESVNIFDISGRLISKFTGNDANQYNVSDLPKGIYEVVAKSKTALSVSKLVKM